MKLFSVRKMTGLLVLASAAPVWAQSETGESASFRLEEIVVTAQHRASTIQDTPIAMTAISSDEMRERQLNTIADVMVQTPALVAQDTPRGKSVYIRGIGSTGDTLAGGDPVVNLNLDGVYQQKEVFGIASAFDISRVEVLRGPQGTLYGRNANAGSINVITNDPVIGENSGYLDLQLGSYSRVRAEGAANIDMGDDLAARVAIVRNSSDGYYSNDGASDDSWATRGKLKYEPSERLTLTLTGLYAKDTGNPPSSVPVPFNEDDPYNTVHPAYNGTDAPLFPPLSAGPTAPPHGVKDVTLKQVYAQLDYDLGFGILTVLPAYSSTRQYQDSMILPMQAVDVDVSANAKSIEARIASSASSNIEWVAGLYGYEADTVRKPNPEVVLDWSHGVDSFPVEFPNVYGERSVAIFGQATVPVTERLRLTGGARYTEDDKSIDVVTRISQDETVPSSQYRNSYSHDTYKLGFEYDLDGSLLYGQVSTGFKAGGVNPLAEESQNSTFDPEEITAYEVGMKNRFLDDLVQLNLSAFTYDYEGFQNTVQGPDCTAASGTSQRTINAASMDNYGGEVELVVTPGRNNRFYADVAYLQASGFFEYQDGVCDLVTGEITLRDVSAEMGPPNAPEWSGKLGYEHWFALANGGIITARADMRWSSSYRTALGESDSYFQEGFTRTDASLGYEPADGRYTVSAYVRNIEDDAQITYTLDPAGIPVGGHMVSEPRTYGVEFSVDF